MRRTLISSAVALALVATMGVHEALAKKVGHTKRHPSQPIHMTLEARNLTTGEVGRNISASAGDVVSIFLRVWNRTGEAQQGVVNVSGGIPGCMIDVTVSEFFEAGQRREQTQTDTVPEGESGVLTFAVSVEMPKTGDTAADEGSVKFGLAPKSEGTSSGGLLQRIFARMLVRSLAVLSDGEGDAASISISEFKGFYR